MKGTGSKTSFQRRRDQLVGLFDGGQLDAYFFSGISDLAYLTGFHSEGYYGLISREGMWLFVSGLLAGQARENTAGCRLMIGKRLSLAVEELAKRHGWKRMGFDAEQVLYRLGDVLRQKGLRPLPNPLEKLRIVKSEEEVSCLRRAGQITAEAVAHVRKNLRLGMTERELARDIETQFYRRGAQGIAFDLIAAVGPHTALPHHHPGDARLTRGSAVLVDVGCRVGGYRSDLTRSFYYGKIPPAYRRIYTVVAEAQRAGIEAVRPGTTGGQVDAATRRVIVRAGQGKAFVHSTGHGVGLDIHEPPWIRPKSPDVLAANMILTVEPGIYLPGRFGVRIEDTVRVLPGGHEILTCTHPHSDGEKP